VYIAPPIRVLSEIHAVAIASIAAPTRPLIADLRSPGQGLEAGWVGLDRY
jgi:hypothetical protein